MRFFQAFVLESSWLFVDKLLVVFGVVFYAQDFNCLDSFQLRVSVHTY